MDENEEKEYNDIESLAAYLHSGKMQAMKAAEERAELGLPEDNEETDIPEDDLEGVLFTLGRKKKDNVKSRKNGRKVISRSEYDSTIRNAPAQPSLDEFIPSPAKEHTHKTAPAQNYENVQPVQQTFDDLQQERLMAPVSLQELNDNKEKLIMSHAEAEENFPDTQQSMILPPISLQGLNDTQQTPIMPEVTEHEYYDPSHGTDIPGEESFYEENIRPRSRKPKEKKQLFEKLFHSKTEDHEPEELQPESNVTSLAESLSESLGEKAAEIAEKAKDALPPEDTPEVFDITEGSAEEEHFDNAATRLMNAVTHAPETRNDAMREEMENEREEIREEKIYAARLRRGYERQKQSTRTLAYILIALILCAAILGAAAFASSYVVRWALDFSGVASSEFKIDIEIPENADIDMIAAILAENNVINDAKFFKTFAGFYDKLKKENENKKFIAGKYTVSSTMPYSTLLKLFRTETTETKTVDVRIVEGMTSREIGELLEQNNVCFADDFEKYYKNIQNVYDFERRVKESSAKMYQLEGYLFPDTYQFYVVNGMENGVDESDTEAYEKTKKESEKNAKTVAMKMYSNFNEKITRSMYKKMGEMHLTLDEVIALASIVQKEAGSPDDMKDVAGVFLNRIRNSAEFPYLQSDVTVLYAEKEIKPYFKGTDAALTRLCNAYNTYVCEGIPAGAVCNPGIDAINAVLYSTDHEYFYFCANEKTGEIFYATTKEEHEKNLVLAGLTENSDNSGNNSGESGTNE